MDDKIKIGTRVRIVQMDGILPAGTCGTVIEVMDKIGDILVQWDNGISLSLIPERDKFKIISKEEE